MCRRTAQSVFDDLGENGKLALYDQLNDVRRMAEIEDKTFAVVKQVVFGRDADPRPNLPALGSYEAGVLLEVMKDLLYQAYVRRGRLQQAMMVRRYFAEESGGKVTPLDQARS
jgi:tRNA(Ile2) C34 agmatinyltransferase TiaS